jgi:hypothetical protein
VDYATQHQLRALHQTRRVRHRKRSRDGRRTGRLGAEGLNALAAQQHPEGLAALEHRNGVGQGALHSAVEALVQASEWGCGHGADQGLGSGAISHILAELDQHCGAGVGRSAYRYANAFLARSGLVDDLVVGVPIKTVAHCDGEGAGFAQLEHAFSSEWAATNKVVNKTTASQECIGVAVSAAANPSATVLVKLGQFVAEGT